MDAGVEVKVEDYDGTYACGFCSESVRGTAALKCSRCSSNPVHTACVAGSTYAWQCMTCRGETMRVWGGGSDETAAPSEVIDLTPDQELEEGGAEQLPTLAEHGVRGDAVPAVGGGVVAADVVARRMREGRADAGGGSSGKGKEPAMDEAGLEVGGDGAATSARAGVGGGGGKGKERADNDRARGSRGRSGGERSSGMGTGRDAWAAQVAGGQRMSSVERAAGSGRRQTVTRGAAEEGASEHKGERRDNVRTIGRRAGARSAEGRAPAHEIGDGTSARSAEERASASTIGYGALAGTAEGGASASSIG